MKRFLLTLLFALAAVVLIAVGLASWLVGTESGARFALARAESLLPYEVELDALDGRLLGPLALGGLTLRDASLEIRVEQARLRWQPRALVGGTLSVDELSLSGVDVLGRPGEQPPDEAPAEGGWRPEGRLAPPIGINVERLSIENLRYRTPSSEPVVVDAVRLAGHWNDNELLVRALEATGPQFRLEGRARVLPAEPYETEARVEWRVEPPAYAAASGTTIVDGNLRRLSIEQQIEAPYGLMARLEVGDPFGVPVLDGRLELDTDLAELGTDLPPAEITADVRIDGPLQQLEVEAEATLESTRLEPLALSLQVRRSGETLVVDALNIAHAASDAEVALTGQAVLDDGSPRFDIDGTWSELQYPLRGDALVASAAGSISAAGSADDYTLEVEADLTTREGMGMPETAGRVRLSGTGGAEVLRLPRIEIEVLGGRLSGAAELGLDPVAADVEMTATELDPQSLAEGWPGSLDGRLSVSGLIDAEGGASVRLRELSLEGRLRDREVAADARGVYESETLHVETLSLESGTTTLEASGSVAAAADLMVSIDSGDLGDLWPGLGGRLRLDGRLSGPPARPRIALEASGDSIELPAGRAGSVMLAADVDVAGEEPSQLDAEIRQAELGDTQVGMLALNGSGTAASHELALNVASDSGDGRVALTGSVERAWQSDFVWRFDLETAAIAPATLDDWQLRAPSSGSIADRRVVLDETCWQSGDASLCVEADYAPDRTTASLALSALPLTYFASLLDPAVEIEGELSAEGELVAASAGLPDLSLSVQSSPGRIIESGGAGVDFGPLEARITSDAQQAEARLHLPIAGSGRIDASASLGGAPGADLLERPLSGALTAELDDLGFVAPLAPDVEDIAGSVHGDVELSGTLGAPAATGGLALENASATLPGPNLELENVRLALSGDGAGDLTLEAHVESGGGSIDGQGALRFAEGVPVGEVTVAGQDFEIADTFETYIVVSPDLELTLAPENINLTGTVVVPMATIRTAGGADDEVVTVSRDQVIVGDEAEEPGMGGMLRPIYANVTLRLGDDVGVDAMGLTGSVAGQIEITEVPEEPTTATGELRVEEGTYEAYGQELEVRTGRLLFAGGPIERPGLDIEAVRQPAEEILVGARVRGTLEQPELSLFSEPPMEQREQLSYLVLGRPLEDTSSAEQSAVSRAAMALGLRGGNFVSDRINRSLGLDEFGLQTQPGESASEASFVIGKYLSPSLYVRYGVGVFESASMLELEYEISERWRLVTESSEEGSGGDLIFNIERRTDDVAQSEEATADPPARSDDADSE